MTPEEKKEAKRLYDIEYRKDNKKKIQEAKRIWYKNNPDIIKEAQIRNKDKKKLADKKYSQKNKDTLNQKKKNWAEANPDKHRKAKTKYFMRKLKEDVIFRFKHNVSSCIKRGVKKNGFSKKSRTYQILGCSFEEFKLYIEAQFHPWMNWENHGNPKDRILDFNKTWDIDHRVPLDTAITEEDVIKLNHYTNLQPLCSKYNREIKRNLIMIS